MQTTDSAKTVAIFGASRADAESLALAERVGAVLAGAGYGVASGGYGGVMEAVSRGAARAGGCVIGVTCRIWSSRPNEFLDEVIETEDLYHRVRALLGAGTAGYVVLPGGTGTMLELATAWEMLAKRLIPERPLICLGEHWRPLLGPIRLAQPASADAVRWAAAPEELPGLLDGG